mmetsp:Transcript_2674/g.8157  ORF Transcript_2674/g.8157 Transcript_2674/m.8157 type:complete len:214 (-) Transcript_2674:1674-2315(-)
MPLPACSRNATAAARALAMTSRSQTPCSQMTAQQGTTRSSHHPCWSLAYRLLGRPAGGQRPRLRRAHQPPLVADSPLRPALARPRTQSCRTPPMLPWSAASLTSRRWWTRPCNSLPWLAAGPPHMPINRCWPWAPGPMGQARRGRLMAGPVPRQAWPRKAWLRARRTPRLWPRRCTGTLAAARQGAHRAPRRRNSIRPPLGAWRRLAREAPGR